MVSARLGLAIFGLATVFLEGSRGASEVARRASAMADVSPNTLENALSLIEEYRNLVRELLSQVDHNKEVELLDSTLDPTCTEDGYCTISDTSTFTSADLGSENLGSENLGSENLGSENLGSEILGSENLGSENLGSENLGSENLGSDYLDSGEIFDFDDMDALGVLPDGVPDEIKAVYSKLVEKIEERKAVMKRDWTDTQFQGGFANNQVVLKTYEKGLAKELLSSLQRIEGGSKLAEITGGDIGSSSLDLFGGNGLLLKLQENTHRMDIAAKVLRRPKTLGHSLDLVGAYLKNYMIDKADAIMQTILPICKQKGGLWEIKALNFYAAIRAKQSRYSDSLTFLQDLLSVITIGEDEEGAWEIYDMVYRNFGVSYEGLGKLEKALEYFTWAMNVKVRAGLEASWFDHWDIGRVQSSIAFRSRNGKALDSAISTVEKALSLHTRHEPQDKVMRAKILHTVGEGYVALAMREEGGDSGPKNKKISRKKAARRLYLKALGFFKDSHRLFKAHKGPYNPLTGREAEAVAQLLMKLNKYEESKAYLLDGLITAGTRQSAWGDGETANGEISSVGALVDRILNAHRETDDRPGLKVYFPGLHALVQNAKVRGMPKVDPQGYEDLIFKSAMVIVAAGEDGVQEKALELIEEAKSGVNVELSGPMISALLASLQAPR
ncbi:hypothetical protein AAMO2058_000319800 [Amorphochlora amoebiformis]